MWTSRFKPFASARSQPSLKTVINQRARWRRILSVSWPTSRRPRTFGTTRAATRTQCAQAADLLLKLVNPQNIRPLTHAGQNLWNSSAPKPDRPSRLDSHWVPQIYQSVLALILLLPESPKQSLGWRRDTLCWTFWGTRDFLRVKPKGYTRRS